MRFKNREIILRSAAGAALLLSASAWAGIDNSKHDFGTGGGAQGAGGAGQSTEICVYCHTPHGANTALSAPLWNRPAGSATYQRYSSLGSATLDGEEIAVGSVSLACLSCHDGTQAMDVVINAPGSGGYNASGAQISTATVGSMTGGVVPNLGTDLRDDHPISIEYAGGSCSGTTADCTPSAATGDPDFVVAQYELINTQNQWWVDTTGGTANKREKTDMILYPRTFTGGSGPSVECGSCHDPHSDTAQPVSFMRISNTNSAVCLACHTK